MLDVIESSSVCDNSDNCLECLSKMYMFAVYNYCDVERQILKTCTLMDEMYVVVWNRSQEAFSCL